MNTLDDLWSNQTIMVETTDYKVVIKNKLLNGWYEGKLLSDCSLGYVESTNILLPGDQQIWTLI